MILLIGIKTRQGSAELITSACRQEVLQTVDDSIFVMNES